MPAVDLAVGRGYVEQAMVAIDLGLRALAARKAEPIPSPLDFARGKLHFEPDPWQVGFPGGTGNRRPLNVARQCAKSTCAAILALHTAMYEPRSLTLLLSPSLRQSGELFRKVQDWAAAKSSPDWRRLG